MNEPSWKQLGSGPIIGHLFLHVSGIPIKWHAYDLSLETVFISDVKCKM